MTLESSLSKAVFNGNGTATEFAFTFKVWDDDQIAVTVSDPDGYADDVTADATIVLDADSGGTVTYLRDGDPLPSGYKLAITRNMPFLQRVDLVSATRFDPQVMEDALDTATAERQELKEQLARAVILPPTSDTTPEQVMESIYQSRDAAAESATAASGSATLAQAWAQSSNPPDSEDSTSKSAKTWAGIAKDWAQSSTAPDPDDTDSKSAKSWAGEAATSATAASGSASAASGSATQAAAWAESDTPPDPNDPTSKSAKKWAEVASDNVPIATTSYVGKVKPDGTTVEIDEDGTLSVPAATPMARGIARLATQAEVQAGAASASPLPAVIDVNDIDKIPAALGGAMMYNVREVLTTSGTWTAPVTGWYKVTCIGGGGGGGAGAPGGAISKAGQGGGQGGTTSFGSITATGGSGGGGGGHGCSSGGGGGAGDVVIGYVYKAASSSVTVTIGAGGSGGARGTGQDGTDGSGPNGGKGGTNGGGSGTAGGGAPGAGNGEQHINDVATWHFGGTGALTGYAYGCGGGGGGGGAIEWGYFDCGGQAFGNAEKGYGYQSGLTSDQYGLGGGGGAGAVILEYFNPAVTA